MKLLCMKCRSIPSEVINCSFCEGKGYIESKYIPHSEKQKMNTPVVVKGIPELSEEEKFKKMNEPTEMQKIVNRRMKDIDAEVQEILESHPAYQRIKAQIAKGIIKYKTPVTPDHYSINGWFEHLQEEMTDAITYNEMIQNKINEFKLSLLLAQKSEDIGVIKSHIEYALKILTDHKEGNN